jgi:hypothetical protein
MSVSAPFRSMHAPLAVAINAGSLSGPTAVLYSLHPVNQIPRIWHSSFKIASPSFTHHAAISHVAGEAISNLYLSIKVSGEIIFNLY